MKRLIYLRLVAALWFAFTVTAQAADVVVIVNLANTNNLSTTMVKKIYTGEMTSWPNGGAVAPIDLDENSEVRASFSANYLGKTVGNMKAFWAHKIFTGRGIPPKVTGSDSEVKNIVSGNANAIGYISASSLDRSVKAISK